MSATATTYEIVTERHSFDYRAPDLSDLTMDEVATALSRLCRWRGATPISVAQHSVQLAHCAGSRNCARWCLIHDSHEMLVADVPSPLKRFRWMAPYVRAEHRLLAAVAERFGLEGEMPAGVKRLDKRYIRNEVDAFLPHAAPDFRRVRRLPIEVAPAWSAKRARREYLVEARRLEIE